MKYSGVTLFCSFILATTLCFVQTRSPCPSENRGVCISEFQVWNKGAGKTQAFVELYFQSGMEVYDYVLRFVSVDRDKLDMTLIGTNQRSSQYVVINSTNQFFEAKNKQPVAIIILSRIHKDDVLDGVVCSDKLSSGTHILKDRFGIGSVMVGDGIFSFSRCGEHFEQTIPTWGKENSCSRDHYVHEVDDDEEYDVPENDDDATAPVLHIHSTSRPSTKVPKSTRKIIPSTKGRATLKRSTQGVTPKPTTNRMTPKPTTNRMTPKPTTNRMTPKPTTNRMTSKPTTNRMTSKPTIKSTTHKLTTRSTKIEIKTKKTTAKPTTDNTKTPSTRKPKTTQGITTAGQSTHQKTTHKISTQTSKKPTAAQMSSSKPTSMIPSSETTSNTKHTTNQVTKTSLNPPTSSTANQPTSSPQPASKPVTPTKHISMRTSPGQTASAKSSAAPITTSPGSGISSSIYRSSTTISLSSSSESRSNPTGSGSKTTNSGFSPSGSHSRLMTTVSSSPPSRAASTTTGPNPLNLFINEVNILLENGINNTFIELQGPHHMTLVNYSIVVFDGQSKATLFHRRFVDADTFTGSGFFVVRDYMSNGNKKSVVVALFDNTRWTQHYQHHVPVTESQGLIDSFVVRTTNDQLNSELLENMVPTHGNRIVTIDPRLLAHRPPVSMSRCLKITLDPGSFLLAPPTMGQPNNCTLEGGHRVQFKLTDAKCRDFKNPKLQDELVDYIVNGINKLCMCGMTQALVTDRKYLCGSLVFESFMRATMPWQSDEIFKNYRTFVARSSTAVVGSQRYHTDSSCYRDCLPPPVNPNSNHGDNVTLTVAVVVSCVGAFLIIVLGVVIYIKRKRTGIVTFRLTNLGEMDTSNMLHDDKDDFVDDDTATFKSISLVTT